jgi:hypothetical protein
MADAGWVLASPSIGRRDSRGRGRRSGLAAVLVGLVAACTLAWSGTASAAIFPFGGTLTDTLGRPVQGVVVELCTTSGSPRVCTTDTSDADGFYSMFLSHSGSFQSFYSVRLLQPADGFVFGQSRTVSSSNPNGDFVMQLGARIEMTFTDPDGQPAAGQYNLCYGEGGFGHSCGSWGSDLIEGLGSRLVPESVVDWPLIVVPAEYPPVAIVHAPFPVGETTPIAVQFEPPNSLVGVVTDGGVGSSPESAYLSYSGPPWLCPGLCGAMGIDEMGCADVCFSF